MGRKAAASNAAFDWFKAGYYFNTINKEPAIAIDCYDKAIKLDPKDDIAWYNKGCSSHNLGRYEEALTCYDKAIELDPKSVYAWNNKGCSLSSLGRYEEALTCDDNWRSNSTRNMPTPGTAKAAR